MEEVDRGQTVLRRRQEGTRPMGTRRRRRSADEEVSCLTSEVVMLHHSCCSQCPPLSATVLYGCRSSIESHCGTSLAYSSRDSPTPFTLQCHTPAHSGLSDTEKTSGLRSTAICAYGTSQWHGCLVAVMIVCPRMHIQLHAALHRHSHSIECAEVPANGIHVACASSCQQCALQLWD